LLGLDWTHLDSLALTSTHLGSVCLAWIHLVTLGLTWSHFDSHGLFWSHWNQGHRRHDKNPGDHDKILLAREMGTYGVMRGRGKPPSRKGGGKEPVARFVPNLTKPHTVLARTHACTGRHETTSQLFSPLPPTFDKHIIIYIYTYVYIYIYTRFEDGPRML
jgi:hypothetical protein